MRPDVRVHKRGLRQRALQKTGLNEYYRLADPIVTGAIWEAWAIQKRSPPNESKRQSCGVASHCAKSALSSLRGRSIEENFESQLALELTQSKGKNIKIWSSLSDERTWKSDPRF